MKESGGHELVPLVYLNLNVNFKRQTMILLVNRSAPVKTIMTRPMGNTSPPIVLIRPGAFSWYHGAAFVLKSQAHPNPSKGPVMKEFPKLVYPHMSFLATYSGDKFNGLLCSEGVHFECS